MLSLLSVLLMTCIFLPSGGLQAQTIAFFPLLDLTVDNNGINNPISERVRQELIKSRKNLVPAADIMRFLVRNRIRSLASLNSYQISLVQKELGADQVLQGIIYQVAGGEHPILCLSLQLSQSSDSKVIWSQTVNISYADQTSLLGINDPHSLEQLYPAVFTQLLAEFPEAEATASTSGQSLNVDSVYIHPKYLRPGEKLFCTIKTHKSADEEGEEPQLFIESAGKQYPLSPTEESNSFETSWTAVQEAGSYPVRLIARWPSGATQDGAIGSYSVDDKEPGVRIILLGTEIDGQVHFNNKLVIIPKLINPEPISHWEISVTDEDDEIIVLQSNVGHIPRNLTWRGQTSQGASSPPGEYFITFKVWDRAERESTALAAVQYLPEQPEILVEITRDDEQLLVDLDTISDTPLSFWWAKFFTEDGKLLKLAQGTELPSSVALDIDSDSRQKIECILSARDVLGNQYKKDISDLFKITEGELEEVETSIETEWVEEF